MPQSYRLAILRDGYPPTIEARAFAGVVESHPAVTHYPDGSVSDVDALRLVNEWNRREQEAAAAALRAPRFAYYV